MKIPHRSQTLLLVSSSLYTTFFLQKQATYGTYFSFLKNINRLMQLVEFSFYVPCKLNIDPGNNEHNDEFIKKLLRIAIKMKITAITQDKLLFAQLEN